MLLCPSGGVKPLDQFSSCHWGRAPANVIVTSATRSDQDRNMYRYFNLEIILSSF